MSLTYLAQQPEQPKPLSDRLDVPVEIRQLATGLSNTTGRISALLGRQWTTQTGIDQSMDELIGIAERALELRRHLCSLKS